MNRKRPSETKRGSTEGAERTKPKCNTVGQYNNCGIEMREPTSCQPYPAKAMQTRKVEGSSVKKATDDARFAALSCAPGCRPRSEGDGGLIGKGQPSHEAMFRNGANLNRVRYYTMIYLYYTVTTILYDNMIYYNYTVEPQYTILYHTKILVFSLWTQVLRGELVWGLLLHAGKAGTPCKLHYCLVGNQCHSMYHAHDVRAHEDEVYARHLKILSGCGKIAEAKA